MKSLILTLNDAGEAFVSFALPMLVQSPGARVSRIRRIVERPPPRSARQGLAGLLLVVTIGALLLPMARAAGDAAGDGTMRPDPGTQAP